MIRLHVLGAGGAVPTASHGPAAYWLEIDGHGLLLDPGPGALVRLVRQPGAPDTVDAVSDLALECKGTLEFLFGFAPGFSLQVFIPHFNRQGVSFFVSLLFGRFSHTHPLISEANKIKHHRD